MNRRSAEILSKGKAEIRAIGESCDPSCFMWFCCANSVPDGICKGFSILDGESKKLLQRNMREDDLLYLEDCVGAVQNGCSPEAKRSLTKEVYRCLKPVSDVLRKEPIERRGFRGMLDMVSPSTSEQSTSKVVIRGFGRGFSGMLDELSRGKKRSIAGLVPQAGIDKCSFDCNYHQYCANFENGKLCKGIKLIETQAFGHENPTNTPKPITRDLQTKIRRRNLGFGGMINEALSRSSDREEKPITCFTGGILGMLEEASKGTDSESSSSVLIRGFGIPPTSIKNPILRTRLGFRGMIDELSGTIEEEVQPIIRSCGLKGMLESAFEGGGVMREATLATARTNPILRDLQTKIRVILQHSR